MLLIALPVSSDAAPGSWEPLSWLFVGLMSYSALSAFFMPRLRAFRRFPQGVPILQWLMACSVFLWGFIAVMAGSPVLLLWAGFGVSVALIILLTVTRPAPLEEV